LVAVLPLSLFFSVSPVLQVLVLLLDEAAQAGLEHAAIGPVLLLHGIRQEIALAPWPVVRVVWCFYCFWHIWCSGDLSCSVLVSSSFSVPCSVSLQDGKLLLL
jgi:hypothetical protein